MTKLMMPVARMGLPMYEYQLFVRYTRRTRVSAIERISVNQARQERIAPRPRPLEKVELRKVDTLVEVGVDLLSRLDEVGDEDRGVVQELLGEGRRHGRARAQAEG